MKNLKFSRLFAAALVVACLALTGCKPDAEDPGIVLPENVSVLTQNDGIVGKWGDNYPDYWAYDGYACQYLPNLIETASYGAHTGQAYIQKITDDSGYIYYQFSDPIVLWGIGEIDVTGKWGAIAYQELTANSVQMCDADYTDQEFVSTLEECVTKYTKANGYFAYITTPFTRPTE